MDNVQLNHAGEIQHNHQPLKKAYVSKPDDFVQIRARYFMNNDESTILQAINPVKVPQRGCNNSVPTYGSLIMVVMDVSHQRI